MIAPENDYMRLAEIWGKNLSDEDAKDDIDRLESDYVALSKDYPGALTERLSMSLRDIAKLRLGRDKELDKGHSMEAKRYQEMMDKIMTSEALKAGDAKPMEAVRVDSIIAAGEKAGWVKDSKIISHDDLVKLLRRDRGKYNNSLDVVDAMMLSIINTMRVNNHQPELTELPIAAQVQDSFEELKPGMTEYERYVMSELGIMPPAREKK
ncbi:MAG: hypothetical protein RR235_05045 [Oscillospiraceae bacterium]